MTAGLRELKKRRTRHALVDAALELFLDRGYEQTTIDEIVGAVEVSQRTFFRYFASKEDVLMDVARQYDAAMLELARSRPPAEAPAAVLLAAMRGVLRTVAEGGAADHERFRRLRQVIETTPALVAAQSCAQTDLQRELAAELAGRMGAGPGDLRPTLLVAIYMAAVRVAFEDCAGREVFDPAAVASRVEESVTLAFGALREDWGKPPA